ncbi:3-oxoacid CoA-transferase subunit B [Achromobacter deleyi]|uniref:3-oxoacid CoA-transferase subunit B n=1 Tax=Achromobacter deleyi TaxID=1353891 RepID=UPI001491A5E7|nr:3-oxoacid CoA-transferase subunit B [Achromobacter deleyi]QVQ27059.1 3-oxoacid CoA-transferase subunit B [Achromobacter deleyi]UIP22645.1 3-oxoacid CoA-transferase subunit B [Achromobacter deleyi]
MTQRYSRADIARRAAADIPPGSYVNLGIGLPVMALDYWTPAHGVTVHSENGILGMRSRSDDDPVDPDLTNAAKQNVAMAAGGSFFNHADSFAMMRGGHLDYCILGAYQVSETGDLANWSLGQPGVAAAVGGAMDLAVGAKRVHVLMEHTTRDGRSRLRRACDLPLTGAACVDRVYTDLATLDVTPQGFLVRDMAPGLTREALQAATDAPLRFAQDVDHAA